MSYYNEFFPNAANWLENLIRAGLINDGYVDRRSITEVQPEDLHGHSRCHFFAGITGWSLALRLAGWPADRPVWTGSCPCQPFSSAGKRKGVEDERHLWPEFRRLIAECRPATVFGEQVASKGGREWFAGVRADLEALGYAVGAADLCAPGVGAPHIRQRLFWMADSVGQRCIGQHALLRAGEGWTEDHLPEAAGCGEVGGLAEPHGRERHGLADGEECIADRTAAGWIEGDGQPECGGAVGHWSDFDLLHCTDGKARRIEPGSFPLAHGVPGRVGRLRAYGNSIVPQLAAEFIASFLDVEEARRGA
jgi:DNA (cytosine-5)-methyltransferase 1